MAEDRKILAQSDPVAATLTDIYTVPALKQAVIATITVANRTASPVAFRISVAVGGAADTVMQYTHYDVSLPANDTYASPPMTLDETDKIRVRAATQSLSFNVFGVEIDI